MADTKMYAKVAGIVLLLLAILGFFRIAGVAPGMLVNIVNLVLGVWGVWAGFAK